MIIFYMVLEFLFSPEFYQSLYFRVYYIFFLGILKKCLVQNVFNDLSSILFHGLVIAFILYFTDVLNGFTTEGLKRLHIYK